MSEAPDAVLGALDPVPGNGFTVPMMIAVLVIAPAWLERGVLLGVAAAGAGRWSR